MDFKRDFAKVLNEDNQAKKYIFILISCFCVGIFAIFFLIRLEFANIFLRVYMIILTNSLFVCALLATIFFFLTRNRALKEKMRCFSKRHNNMTEDDLELYDSKAFSSLVKKRLYWNSNYYFSKTTVLKNSQFCVYDGSICNTGQKSYFIGHLLVFSALSNKEYCLTTGRMGSFLSFKRSNKGFKYDLYSKNNPLLRDPADSMVLVNSLMRVLEARKLCMISIRGNIYLFAYTNRRFSKIESSENGFLQFNTMISDFNQAIKIYRELEKIINRCSFL